MNIKVVVYFIGKLVRYLGMLMFLPLICSFIYKEGDHWAFIISIVITIFISVILLRLTNIKDEIELRTKEAFAVVTFGWMSAALLGAMPFIINGTFTNIIDAIFESTSGFTTTGATVLVNIEEQTHAILLWRDFTHWLGGMGIIVLTIAILPITSVGGLRLLSAEAPGPSAEKLKPRIASTAKSLWGVYIIISMAEILLLIIAGMPVYDAVCHMFGTMGTGGFSIKGASIGAYNSPLIEIIVIIFMFIAGTSFVLHYNVLRGNSKKLFTNSEFRFYCFMAVATITLVTINIWGKVYADPLKSLRYASFQCISILTTTGYTTANFDAWPSLSRGILLTLMFVGGCAGSTGGAMKNVRILILIKKAFKELTQLVHPKAIIPLKLGNQPVGEPIVKEIMSFFLLYMSLFVLCSLIMMALGLDMVSALTSVAATIGNIGPGLNMVGATQNYAWIPGIGKLVLAGCMLIGRLEVFTVLVLFVPLMWKE